MSREKGEIRTCDRCKATVFLRCTGEGERDGGYTRWNEFEPAEGWGHEYGMGDLCPTCMEKLVRLREDFMTLVNKEAR